MTTETDEAPTGSAPTDPDACAFTSWGECATHPNGVPDRCDLVEVGPYVGAVEEYLAAASWLGPGDAPLKVHARSIAKSLDKQLEERGEVQSALASSFDKVLMRLDARRPPPAPAVPGLGDSGPMGEQSIFTVDLPE